MTPADVAATLRANVGSACRVLDALVALAGPLARAADMLGTCLTGGHKLLCCGNGGSAADCSHLTTEIAARYRLPRAGFPAIDLTANHSLVTALVNDYPPDEVFARQVRAFGSAGDVLLALSTSGQSPNVLLALQAAARQGLRTIALLGRDGGRCRHVADVELLVPDDCTARVQEAHLLLYHTLCELLDPILAAAAEQ